MERALGRWQSNLNEAKGYLDSRGIQVATAERFSLGVVLFGEEQPFDKYTNRLAIPYFDRLGPVGFTFRCIAGHDCKESGCPKYLQMDGQEVGFFNVLSLDSDDEVAHICEGEIDAITLSQVVVGPCLAISGATKWKPHFPYHLSGFDRVMVWSDGDNAGKKMAEIVRASVPNADIVEMPAGEDVNSIFCSKGSSHLIGMFQEGDDDEQAN